MDLNDIVNTFREFMKDVTHSDWFATALTVVITLIITMAISHLVTKVIKKMLNVDNNPLPSSSIFINIGRVIVWVIGICVILSSCFNVNISAAITALGIGGLAVSLGFQATLSNLIGGLQITLAKLVVPGDHIMVGTNKGIVKDVTWRHTSIVDANGQNVIIPNSLINTSALIILPPETLVSIPIFIDSSLGDLDSLITKMQDSVDKAVSKIALVKSKPAITLEEVTDQGYKALLQYTLEKGSDVNATKNAALSAISSHAKEAQNNQANETGNAFIKDLTKERKK